MATVSKLLIRLQKFSSKISKVIDATDSFSSNNNYYQDLSGWDSAVVQVVGLTGSIGFGTTNDDGSITGQLLPAPEVPINWVPVLGVDLATKTDVFSIAADGIVEFGIIGKYLLLQGSAEPTTTTTTTVGPTTTTTTTVAPTTTTTTLYPGTYYVAGPTAEVCSGTGPYSLPLVVDPDACTNGNITLAVGSYPDYGIANGSTIYINLQNGNVIQVQTFGSAQMSFGCTSCG